MLTKIIVKKRRLNKGKIFYLFFLTREKGRIRFGTILLKKKILYFFLDFKIFYKYLKRVLILSVLSSLYLQLILNRSNLQTYGAYTFSTLYKKTNY